MKTCCIAVIGHVDHGKTSLVHALTGVETDRLPEEKARGLSIETGFAHSSYPSGALDFIDTPGHENFVQAMVSGTTGAGAVLLVISAVEGLGAQTLEHLNIARLLGITRGVIAVTKSDMLPPSALTARLAQIRAALSQTPLNDASLVVCSTRTGDGIDALHDALEGLLATHTTPAAPLHGTLPIDRVFSLAGLGTIVTGTLLGPDLSIDDTLTLQPDGREITLRGLQSRGVERDRIHTGERMAANLRGVAVADIPRGSVLSAIGATEPSMCMDVQLELLPTAQQTLKHMQDVRVLLGTSSEIAQVRLFSGGQIMSTGQGFAQLRFTKPVVGFAGQRAILRRLSPSETLGGAVLLDPAATPTKAGDKARLRVLDAVQQQDTNKIAQAVADGGTARVADVARLSRRMPDDARAALDATFFDLGADLICCKADFDAAKDDLLASLAAFHKDHLLRSMAPRSVMARTAVSPSLVEHVEKALVTGGEIIAREGQVALSGHDPFTLLNADQRDRLAKVELAVQDAGLTPPTRESLQQDALGKDLLQLLVDRGSVVSLHNVSLKQNLLFHKDTLTSALGALRSAFPTRFTTGEARNVLDTSRRIIVPLLEHFDARGRTVRDGDMRQVKR